MYASTLPRSNWLRRASIRLAWYRHMPASSFPSYAESNLWQPTLLFCVYYACIRLIELLGNILSASSAECTECWGDCMSCSCTDCRKPQHQRIVFLIISFFEFLSEHVVNKVSGWRFKLTLNFTGFCANGRYLIYYAAVSQIILMIFWFFGLGFKFPPVSICFVDIMQASEMAYSITAAASQCNSVSLPIYS